MTKYLVHHENGEIQLRAQDSMALGFCRIIESIPVDNIPSNNGYNKYAWLDWYNEWKQFFIKKYSLNPEDVM